MGFKEWIIPQDRVFFDLLERHIHLAGECATEFRHMMDNWQNLEAWRNKIKALEHQADETGHELFERLNATFITPIDREDIARLAHSIDDIADAVNAATNRIALYEIPAPTPWMAQFIDVLRLQIKELESSIACLRRPASMKKEIPARNVEIHRLENEADRLIYKATAELFKTNDPIHIMKYKEIYEFLETATDKCEDVADVMQDILRKHA